MFHSQNSSAEEEILKYKDKVDKILLDLQKNLDLLVYWESIYNRDNNISKNPEHLELLIYINKVTKTKTPSGYFITANDNKTDKKIQNKTKQINVILPENFNLNSLKITSVTKKEIFELKEDYPYSEKNIIIKTEKDGDFHFLKITKHKNIETEKTIDAKEYLFLTTHINTQKPRTLIVKYSFIYKNNIYELIVDSQKKSAILDYPETAEIPHFFNLK